MQNDSRNPAKTENVAPPAKEVASTKFSLNSLNNRLSMKFSSTSSATSSTSSAASAHSGSNSLKLRKNSHVAFQFLRSKPPINPTSSDTPATTTSSTLANKTSKVNISPDIFTDASQVLNDMDDPQQTATVHFKQIPTIITHQASVSRLSYPFNSESSLQNNLETAENATTSSSQASAKTSAKRLLFNFISGNSSSNDASSGTGTLKSGHSHNMFKMQHLQQLQMTQQRRLSDYHRPLKVSDQIGVLYLLDAIDNETLICGKFF